MNFELPQKSVAVLLGHPLDNVIIVDAPYKHFSRIAASDDQTTVVQGQCVELLVSDSGSEIVRSEFYRK